MCYYPNLKIGGHSGIRATLALKNFHGTAKPVRIESFGWITLSLDSDLMFGHKVRRLIEAGASSLLPLWLLEYPVLPLQHA